MKMSSYQNRNSHYGDKTILRPSYLHSGISCTRKTASLCGIRSQVPICLLTSIGIPMLKIRRSRWESPYLGKTVFILRRGPGRLRNPLSSRLNSRFQIDGAFEDHTKNPVLRAIVYVQPYYIFMIEV